MKKSLIHIALITSFSIAGMAHASLHDEYQANAASVRVKAENDALKLARESSALVGMKIVAQEKHAGFGCEYNTGDNSFGGCEYLWTADVYQKMADGRLCFLQVGIKKLTQSRNALHAIEGVATCVLRGKAVNGYRFIRYYGDNNVLTKDPQKNSNFVQTEVP